VSVAPGLSWVFLALAFMACHRAPSIASARAEASAPSRELRIEAVVCAGRPDCHLESVVEGGQSQQGAELFVAMVGLPKTQTAAHRNCTPHDVWLGSALGQEVTAVHRLAQDCAETAEVSIRALGPGQARFAVSRDGPPDAGIVDTTYPPYERDFALDPLMVTRVSYANMFWDYREFKGATCGGDGVQPCVDPSLTLPSLDPGDAFAAGGWRTTSLGQCAMRFGPVRALLSRGALYIEVAVDAAAAAPGRLQIDLAPDDPYPSEMESWSLGMDGTLGHRVDGKNERASAHVESVTDDPSVHRFRLTHAWRENTQHVHMSYGAYRSGTDGTVRTVPPTDAVCTPIGGVLEVTRQSHDLEPWQEVVR
jgi:hypothetical protein